MIGNHDTHGWGEGKDKDGQPLGKRWGEELLGLENRFYSFDQNGWHFIVLDGVQPRGNGYTAHLDGEQYDWLVEDLQRCPAETPVLISSHIPIVAASVLFNDGRVADNQRQVPGGLMHTDAGKLKDLFLKHPNVKLCLSGHLHQVDRIDYHGVTYLCSGAVSGAWWRGKHAGFAPGYAVIDLYEDGSFEPQYVTYGWEARNA